eukprot:TRINITY_DN887_c0_g2_i1.p1 TRINITY_DN887_c0_g2~~TRINITY_DN887_c0_g2_i1.p1  ORF type:complete len:845 (-),score=185.07 TRINITY_DN887_c0_g2_i1:138-2672(-)
MENGLLRETQKNLKTNFKKNKCLSNIFTGGRISVNSSETRLASCCSDLVKIVEIESGKWKGLRPDGEAIIAVALDGEGNRLAVSSMSQQLYYYANTSLLSRESNGKKRKKNGEKEDIKEEEQEDEKINEQEAKTMEKMEKVRQWKGHEGPSIALAFHPSGSYIASGGAADFKVKVWDSEGGFQTHDFIGHTATVHSLVFHPRKYKLFSTSDDKSIRIWDLETKQCAVLNHHLSTVTSLQFSRNGKEMISASRDKLISVWNLEDNKLKKNIPSFESLEGVAIIEEYKNEHGEHKLKTETVLSAGERGVLKFWSTESGKQQSMSDEGSSITNLAFLKRSNRILTTTSDHDIMIYDRNTLKLEKLYAGYSDEILEAKFLTEVDNSSNKIQNRIVVASNSPVVRIFDSTKQTSECSSLVGHKEIVVTLDSSFHPELGPIVATGSKDNEIKLWSVNSLSCIATCTGHTESVNTVAFSQKSLSFLISGSADKTIKMWNIHVSDSGKVTMESKYTDRAHDKEINAVCVSPNDKLIATASQDKLVKIWTSDNLTFEGTLKGHKRGVWSVQFSPVEQCCVTASADKFIKIWNINDFTCLKTFEGHTNAIIKASFISQGMQILSGGSDGIIKLWSVKNNECINTFNAHKDKVWALCISRDESKFISGGADSKIHVWNDISVQEQEEKIRMTEEILLKQQELNNYLVSKDYKKAIKLAFALDQPNRIFSIFEEIVNDSEASIIESNPTFQQKLSCMESIVTGFGISQLAKCLEYIRDWNTNAKKSLLAQGLLNVILTKIPVSKLQKVSHFKEIVEGLLPYTERHFQRSQTLLQKSYLIDYTLQRMDSLLAGISTQ